MHKWVPLIVVGLMAAVAVAGMFRTAAVPAVAQEPTPTSPAPTWTPGPPATKTPVPAAGMHRSAPGGGCIELRVQFSTAWPWARVHWRDLWVVVQWQDGQDEWHAVEGWQGALDEIVAGEQGEVVGRKRWWVDRDDLGKGPFRWAVYEGQGRSPLAVSEPFHLPASDGKTVGSEVVLRRKW